MDRKILVNFLLCILAFAFTIAGAILNFQSLLMGTVPNLKNILVSVVYLLIWIDLTIAAIKDKDHIILEDCSVS